MDTGVQKKGKERGVQPSKRMHAQSQAARMPKARCHRHAHLQRTPRRQHKAAWLVQVRQGPSPGGPGSDGASSVVCFLFWGGGGGDRRGNAVLETQGLPSHPGTQNNTSPRSTHAHASCASKRDGHAASKPLFGSCLCLQTGRPAAVLCSTNCARTWRQSSHAGRHAQQQVGRGADRTRDQVGCSRALELGRAVGCARAGPLGPKARCHACNKRRRRRGAARLGIDVVAALVGGVNLVSGREKIHAGAHIGAGPRSISERRRGHGDGTGRRRCVGEQ